MPTQTAPLVRRIKRTSVFLLTCFGGALLAGCSSDAGANTDDEGAEEEVTVVELFSWWSSEGELEALNALVTLHEADFPNQDISVYASSDGEDSTALLQSRLNDGEPPDVFQENVHDIGNYLKRYPDSLQSLTQLFEEQGWNDVFSPEILELIEVDGDILTMPVGMHRENSLFYNIEIFEKQELEPPSTMEELFATCDQLNSAGITPLATGY